jgi:hypothetical protein
MHSFKKLAGVGLVAVAAATAACGDFLEVPNPSAVPAENLDDTSRANLLVNGAIGQFQTMIDSTALWGSLLSDESRAAHVNISYAPIDLRTVSNLNDIVPGVYRPIQRARFAADTVADRLKGFNPTGAASDLRIARMLAMSGYGHMILGETFCQAPVNGGASLTPAALFALAAPRFDEAIAVATAARAVAVGAGPIAAADSVLGLATVGAARNALNLNDKTKALQYTTQLPAGFTEYRVYYTEGVPASTVSPVNAFYNGMGSPTVSTATTGNVSNGFSFSTASLWVVVDSAFQNLNDPRVPHTSNRVNAMNASSQFVAGKPRSFGGYVAPTATNRLGTAMTPGASIRVASRIEAQYIAAEAAGGVASTLTFVNAQRAANSQPVSTAATPDAILADLRDQKRREFYLDGHRLGEIRRYKAQYNGLNFFPTGPNFGTVECFPLPIAETNANPNAT